MAAKLAKGAQPKISAAEPDIAKIINENIKRATIRDPVKRTLKFVVDDMKKNGNAIGV